MPTIRPVQAWYTEVVEIRWSRPKDPNDPTSVTETLVERHTAPPPETWHARRQGIAPEPTEESPNV